MTALPRVLLTNPIHPALLPELFGLRLVCSLAQLLQYELARARARQHRGQ